MVSISDVSVWGSEKVAERVWDKGFETISDFSPWSGGDPACYSVAEG